jgi:hypothetical chaperone protein
MPDQILALDFGTSNSAAAILENGAVRIIPLEAAAPTLPSAIFLDFDSRDMILGEAAIAALVDGREGRFMRALKSVLGTPLFHEKRQFLNARRTLSDIVTEFLMRIRERAEMTTGHRYTHVQAGRPVRFHHRDEDRNRRAGNDLEGCLRAAGFDEVSFMFEPEAAALASSGDQPGTGLIVDIGGGTSDFSVFQQESGDFRILASHGIRLGGTDFDRSVSLDHVMPLLGRGTELRAEFGTARHVAPNAIFHDLSTWARIPFLYSPQTRRDVARMLKVSDEPDKLRRLSTVLENELGHDIAFAVERGKIAANGAAADGAINLGMIEQGLEVRLGRGELAASLSHGAVEIAEAARACIDFAGLSPDQVDRIVLVGGSSLMSGVADAVAGAIPSARIERGSAFTAIIDGLALATART